MNTQPTNRVLCLVAAALLAATVSTAASAVTIQRDPLCSSGKCDVDNFDLFSAAVGTPLVVDVMFTDMRHIELDSAGPSTTNIEFGIGNTGNSVDLGYQLTFDLIEMDGSLLTSNLLVVTDTAPAGFNHIRNQPLTTLPAGLIFHGLRITAETTCIDAAPGSCNFFDLRVAGGGGSAGTAVSGPIVFNRATGGIWMQVPAPAAAPLVLGGAALLVLRRRVRRIAAG